MLDNCMSGIFACGGSRRNAVILPVESGEIGDRREGRHRVAAGLLIVGDDVTGCAPTPRELLAVAGVGGERGNARAEDQGEHGGAGQGCQ